MAWGPAGMENGDLVTWGMGFLLVWGLVVMGFTVMGNRELVAWGLSGMGT